VYTFTKLNDRRIPNRQVHSIVGVGLVLCILYVAESTSVRRRN